MTSTPYSLSTCLLRSSATTVACKPCQIWYQEGPPWEKMEKIRIGGPQKHLTLRTLTTYITTTAATNSYSLGHWGTHSYCDDHSCITGSTQNQSHHVLPNCHTKIYLQAKDILYESHSTKFVRSDTRCVDMNSGTQETGRSKNTKGT